MYQCTILVPRMQDPKTVSKHKNVKERKTQENTRVHVSKGKVNKRTEKLAFAVTDAGTIYTHTCLI